MLSWLLGVICGGGVALLWSIRVRRNLWQQLERVLPVAINFKDPTFSSLRDYQRNQDRDRQALYDALRRANTLLQYLPVAVFQVDASNVVMCCNVAAQSLFEIAEWEAGSRLLLEWIRSFELDALVETVREQQQLQRTEWVYYPTEGQSIPLRAWGVPLLDNYVALIVVDRREAVSLAQQRDRWASDVAHELKTPLTSIRLVAERLQVQVKSDLKPWVDRLLNEVIRLSSLVQDLLELSRLDMAAAAALKISHVDIVKVVNQAWQNLEPLTRDRDQALQCLAADAVWAWVDEARLYRVIFNLLDNASKFSPSGSVIQVRLEQRGDVLGMSVRDQGPGFPLEALPQVFDRFYRADSARVRTESNGVSGSGLGLAIVRQIIEAHGGMVEASNSAEGGALVRVQFPVFALKPD